MCGINGIFAYHYAAPPVDLAEVEKTRDHMRRRGPDGKGLWSSDDERVGIGHRRLKIIDLTDEAAQPMVSTCGRFVISYNGEIYNYQELRKKLEARGRLFRTKSDTEVLLEMFAEFGTDMFSQLRGMYAFGVWDRKKKRLLLARDTFGIKPLYYADDGWSLRFASQVKALRHGGKIADDPEPAGHAGFLLFGSVPEPFTLWQEVRALPAGHYLWCDELGAGLPVAHIAINDLQSSEHEVNLAAVIRDSVRTHLTADVPVAAFLSSGIDSSVLVALARELMPNPIQTITIGFKEFEQSANDECPLAAQLAASLGTDHHQRRFTRSEFESDLPDILQAMDQPSIDGINTWMVSKACAEVGIKVALSGLGADEVFGGYPSFINVPAWRKRTRWASWIPGLGALLRRAGQNLLPWMGINIKAAGMLEYGGTHAGAYLLQRGLFMPWEISGLMGRTAAGTGLKRLSPLGLIDRAVGEHQIDPFSRVSLLEQSMYMRNQLLRDADWASMAHSLEIRVPYVDVTLQRTLGRSVRHKSQLVEVAANLVPPSIAERPKTGFTTPLANWRHYPHGHWSRGWAQEIQCAFSP